MKLAARLMRLERVQGSIACPLCARGVGKMHSVMVEGDGPPDPMLYVCPHCGAAPESLRVIRFNLGDLAENPAEEALYRARFQALAAGDPDGPRARAVADLLGRRSGQRGRKSAATTPRSRKTHA